MSFSDTCEKCGRVNVGDSYQYYYGRLLSTQLTRIQNLGTSIAKTYTSRYQILGAQAAFFCDRCAKRHIRFFLLAPFCYWLLLFFALAVFGLSGGYVTWHS